ncbi:TfoX/Sxy family protein [Pseudomonas sp. 21LCFQ010]|uniref:TfoX/Sxy family protein n=1 Tax=Pseudomonas sp. 21LCFQ010 TaxID=2957506 RepID=UPI002097E6D6|nr:TfoX/Sxy family protein [Pseudomonas sp. 21LCFQ010]MCO8165941.1 TfoX/Sxy family protein [Pseudomonas sp. 21LCFQ010]
MNELAAYIEDIFALFGPVSLRRMFGGHGIFRDGVMFGLVFDHRARDKPRRSGRGRIARTA